MWTWIQKFEILSITCLTAFNVFKYYLFFKYVAVNCIVLFCEIVDGVRLQ